MKNVLQNLIGGTTENWWGREDDYEVHGPYKIRLCFKLKNELTIKNGTGERDTPYELKKEE